MRAARIAVPVRSSPEGATELQNPGERRADPGPPPRARPRAVRASRAVNLASVKAFCVRVPVFKPVAFEAVSSQITPRPTA